MRQTNRFTNWSHLDQAKFHGRIIIALNILIGLALLSRAHAETYTVNGKAGQPKIAAIVALAKDPNSKVERCQYKEKQDSNSGAVLCRNVELSPRGTIRLQK